MLMRTESLSRGPSAWRTRADVITDPAELIDLLGLESSMKPAARRAAELFGFRVTRSFASRMCRGDPLDPLLRQVLPVMEETLDGPAGFVGDPVGDLDARVAPGVLHKYPGRALLVVTGACGTHCRYCFRRHFPYREEIRPGTAAALNYLRNTPGITEVILSGGDPLTLGDGRLSGLVSELEAIPYIKHLRLHTRQPVFDPARVNDSLLDWMRSTGLRPVVVIHANHPNEIDGDVANALGRLSSTGAVLLNQSVLLRGVNDDTETLVRLSQRLFEVGVMPYYLHVLDRVRGAAHFLVSDSTARALHRGLRASLPGYLVPRLAREDPGMASKTLLV